MDNLINDLLEWEEIDISFLEKPEEFSQGIFIRYRKAWGILVNQ